MFLATLSKIKQNGTHTTPVSVAWALLLESNGVQCLAFVAGNKKVGGGFLYFPSVWFLQCICLTACITVLSELG